MSASVREMESERARVKRWRENLRTRERESERTSWREGDLERERGRGTGAKPKTWDSIAFVPFRHFSENVGELAPKRCSTSSVTSQTRIAENLDVGPNQLKKSVDRQLIEFSTDRKLS